MLDAVERATFTPAAAARITGVSAVLQRDWRRRGYLPSVPGHARFSTVQLAEIWVMGLLAERGIGPQQSKGMAFSAAMRIAAFAHLSASAWDGAVPPDRQRAEFAREGLSTPHIPRFLLWLPDGPAGFADTLTFFDEAKYPQNNIGAVVVLDLRALGNLLVERAGKPLIKIIGNSPA